MTTYKVYNKYEQLHTIIREVTRMDYDTDAITWYTNKWIEENKQGLIEALQNHDYAIKMLKVNNHYDYIDYRDLVQWGVELFEELEKFNKSGYDTYGLEECIQTWREWANKQDMM